VGGHRVPCEVSPVRTAFLAPAGALRCRRAARTSEEERVMKLGIQRLPPDPGLEFIRGEHGKYGLA
jgi:hypothetical protein